MLPVQFNSVDGVRSTGQIRQAQKSSSGADFASTLQGEVAKQNGVKISTHAQKRLDERNIQIDEARLSAAVDRIEEKGADKSLVLMDNLALLVSARNRTVITALDSESAKDGVFTNIDSAVII